MSFISSLELWMTVVVRSTVTGPDSSRVTAHQSTISQMNIIPHPVILNCALGL